MQTENRLHITAGEWEYNNNNTEDYFDIESTHRIASICAAEETEVSREEHEANAILIVDAGNTYNKCGLLPSELLKQGDELREVLENLTNWVILNTPAMPAELLNAKLALRSTRP